MPTLTALSPASWADLAPVAPLLLIPFLLVGLAIRRDRRSRRHAAELARRGKPRPPEPKGRGWVWVLLVTVVVLIAYQISGRSAPPLGLKGGPLPADPGGPWTLILATTVTFVLLVAVAAWRQRRDPIARAARQATAGDVPGAIAAIEARVAARRAGAPAPADPDDDLDANPYSPPTAAIAPAGARGLADDLNMLGVLEGMRRDWAAAHARFEEADALVEGAMPTYRSNRGIALVRLGRVDAGLALVDEALGDLPPDDHPNRFQILGQAAVTLAELGRRAEATAWLDAAEAACRRITAVVPGARKAWLGQVAKLRARLDAAEAKAAKAETPAPPTEPTPAG